MDIGLFLSVMAASLLVAVVSLICTVFLYVSDSRLKIWMPRLIAIAVGVLLGDAFLHLIPDALDLAGGHQSSVGLWVLVGVISFFFMETVLQWRHEHNPGPSTDRAGAPAIEAYKFLSAQEIDLIANDAVQAGKPYQQWRDRRKTRTGTHLDGAHGSLVD
ncbi:MAG TPA: hypothetical protein DEF79_11320 [Gammaproteobacteria bacterium]|nr:hypothetical protein [Gammaproteobacteria bacterium]